MEIGLVVALSLVIVAFTYTPDEYRIQKVAVNVMPVDVDIVPVTTDSPKQKPQKVEIKALSQLIEVIPNHRFVQTDLTFEEFDPDAIVEIVPPARTRISRTTRFSLLPRRCHRSRMETSIRSGRG